MIDAETRRKLTSLRRKAESEQWSLEEGIDWSVAPVPAPTITSRFIQRSVGALFAGEQATVRACDRLIEVLPAGPVRDCIAVQSNDEFRHVEAYARYMERTGLAPEPHDGIREVTDRLARWSGPTSGLFFAIHIVLEGEALGLQLDVENDLDCPLFRSVNRRISRDEARHVAFGRIIAASAAREMDEHDRRRTVDEIRAVWTGCVKALAGENFFLWRALSFMADRSWNRHMADLARTGLLPSDSR